MNRQLLLNDSKRAHGNCVLYVMSRDQRVKDNHALLKAQRVANESRLPLIVMFNLTKIGVRSREQYDFMLEGLRQVERALKEKNIQFILKIGDAFKNINEIISEIKPVELVFDFSPMEGARNLQKKVAKNVGLPVSVVDTHNIIPCWLLSDKEEYAAHTIRSKVHKNLEVWVKEPGDLETHQYKLDNNSENDWEAAEKYIKSIKANNTKNKFMSGEENAHQQLRHFIDNKLSSYAEKRNIPTIDGQSNLSPYLHFGQLSSLRIVLEIIKTLDEPPLLFRRAKLADFEGEAKYIDSVNAYLEELIVRKELADNFVFYNSNYTKVEGAKDWAKESLNKHENDPREFTYELKQFESANTHDEVWNAAQNELLETGKMHGYMRMYWAKKILEWTKNPQQALDIAIYLNDHYSIDGGDPNGYTGIMWSIAGIHDRPWFEREVYGKIRYMNDGGLKRRFDLDKYIQTWL